MKKHAYLIMAYNNFDFLKRLINLLDDERNDIYVHIDKKSLNFNESEFKNATKYSKLTFIGRKQVLWADYSEFDVELDLMQAAREGQKKGGGYHYYHLLSGMDLPLKTQDEIHNFFDSKDEEFIGIVPKEFWYSVRRVKFYHPFTSLKSFRKHKTLKICDRLLEYLQRLVRINRIRDLDIKIIDGWQWVSITDNFVKYLLENRSFIEKTFSKTIACTELVMQTMAYNSEFRKKIYCMDDLKEGSQRYIDWGRGKPYVFRESDFEDLINSPYMFARKIDVNTDNRIAEKIISFLNKKAKNE